MNLARIVLNPRNVDGSGAPMNTEIVDSQGEFPCSYWKNQLNFSTFEFDTDHFNFVLGRGGDVVFTAKVDGTGDAINPTSHDANGASFTGLNVEAGHSLTVYRGGAVWFTITAQASGGGPDQN